MMQELIRLFGYGLCHQLPERTLQSGGFYFTVCARDTGIHIGFAAALLVAAVQFAWYRRRGQLVPADLPPVPILIILALSIIPLAWDGLTSYLGLRETTNLIRYLTGMCCGVALGSLTAPLLAAATATADRQRKAYQRPASFILQLGGSLALCGGFYLLYPGWGVWAAWVGIAALLCALISLNLLVFSATLFKQPLQRWWQWLPWLALALLATLVELTILGLLRYLLLEPLLHSLTLWNLLL